MFASRFVIFLTFVYSNAEVHKVQLIKAKPPGERGDEEGALRLPESNPHQSITMIRSSVDAKYVGEITIGTPEQKFRLLIDTASANTFVADVSCKPMPKPAICADSKCNAGLVCKVFCPDQSCCLRGPKPVWNACDGKNLFNMTASESYKKAEGKWNSKNPAAEGFSGNDTVRLGDSGCKQLTVPGSIFGQATQLSDSFAGSEFDGVLGLAFDVIASGHLTSPVSRAMQLGLLEKPLFTVYLGSGKDDGGLITYGALDVDNCGPILAWEHLTVPIYWQFKLTAVASGKFSSNSKWTAMMDSKSSMIKMPTGLSQAIAEENGAELGHYRIDCASTAALTLTIGQRNYTVTSKNLVLPTPDGHCIFAISGFTAERHHPSWILGVPFSRRYCTVHDFGEERIGFAETRRI
ncbi:unnamed protein product [Nippostrongylus brasiliensis]|uniref:Peptidase A1 domain-containing protein n=1 Tax=Nippostrongylus brasiliensis TaxID=27835 RepID=A0A0N4XZW0_NIPBR|nr:unnamed protein product [Nippostrongylus brasiliensis]